VITLDHVSKTYLLGSEPVYALRDVTEHIGKGEYVAIMGPSGSGKSTMLNILGCLDRPSAGTYTLDGDDVSQLSDDELSTVRRRKIGFVFQSFHLIPRLSAVENVALPMMLEGVPRGERRERAMEALAHVGLDRRARHRPPEMSGGERQRVAVARATILRPAVMFADEPTGNLDSVAGKQVMDLLERLNADGLTMLLVTHDPGVGRRAHRALRMHDGRIAERVRQRDGVSVVRRLA
jgi:putative ABC transport system ATP-binding protein